MAFLLAQLHELDFGRIQAASGTSPIKIETRQGILVNFSAYCLTSGNNTFFNHDAINQSIVFNICHQRSWKIIYINFIYRELFINLIKINQ
jgi:hypothetical protein